MRKTFLVTVTSFLFIFAAQSFVFLPEKFTITERIFTTTSAFDLEEDSLFHGKISRPLISLTLNYNYYDAADTFQGVARRRILAIGTIFDVSDRKNLPVGRVEKKIISLFPTYDIYNEEGDWILHAHLNFWGTSLTFKKPSSEVIATIRRPFITFFKDTWTAEIISPKEVEKIDSRLITLIPVIQTDFQKWAKMNSSSKSMAIPSSRTSGIEVERLNTWVAAMKNDLIDIEAEESDFQIVVKRTSQFLETLSSTQKREIPTLHELVKNIHLFTADNRELKAFVLLVESKIRSLTSSDFHSAEE